MSDIPSASPTPAAFSQLVAQALALGFTDVVLVMTDEKTGRYAIRNNGELPRAIGLIELVAQTVLDELCEDSPEVARLLRTPRKDVI